MKPRVWAFTLAYNEELLLPYWVRHYRTICERVIVYLDVESNDRSQGVAETEGAEVRSYQNTTGLDDVAFVQFANEHYREARGHADYVIWTDTDEFLYHPRLPARMIELQEEHVDFPRVEGYNMFSDSVPTTPGQIYEQIRRGIRSPAYDKVCIFDPRFDVQWTTGKHDATVSPDLPIRDLGDDSLKLLHYRWLGEEWYRARSERNYSRLNADNIARGHGYELYPGYQGMYSLEWYKQKSTEAIDCL